jgi:hypothetical protein
MASVTLSFLAWPQRAGAANKGKLAAELASKERRLSINKVSDGGWPHGAIKSAASHRGSGLVSYAFLHQSEQSLQWSQAYRCCECEQLFAGPVQMTRGAALTKAWV